MCLTVVSMSYIASERLCMGKKVIKALNENLTCTSNTLIVLKSISLSMANGYSSYRCQKGTC